MLYEDQHNSNPFLGNDTSRFVQCFTYIIFLALYNNRGRKTECVLKNK